MHILHIYKDYPPVLGGIEGYVRDLAEGLVARNHRVTVLVTNTSRCTSIERPLPGLTVVRAARLVHLASTPLSPAMIALARSICADLVHLHFPYPPGDLAAMAAPGSSPLVISYHSDIVRQQTLLRLYRPLLALTLRRAARIIASSPGYIASSPFLRPHAAKCEVVPIGVDITRFAPGDRRAAAVPRLLFVGRLRYYKGLHILIDALRQVEDVELWIAGNGPERVRLERQVADAGLRHRVRFLGDVADVDLPALYQQADIFVLPSHLRAEAFGIVLVEALASGLPCISTALGTGTDFVNVHEETGLVVPPGDAAALAEAIRRLRDDPALRAKYGEAGVHRARMLFSRERMLDAVEMVYGQAVR
ncbi:MAG: glycosyltransferase [Roseiflexaceae bacterium]|nr:glycosyltransferase [Roseiflexus sp.]MDW8213291.1 glycosyltransferase [Roseiflexaceae bacterium]